jgi:hypothetical protein
MIRFIKWQTASVACLIWLAAVNCQAQRNHHRHANTGDAMGTVASEIEIIEAEPDKILKKEIFARNRQYESFVVHKASVGYRIFFAERKSKKIYEIRGVPLGWRPFSDLLWLDDRTLAFDRWANPHHGSHYEVDAQARKLNRALIFSDANED